MKKMQDFLKKMQDFFEKMQDFLSILRIVINNGKKFVTKVFWKLKSQIENEININQSFYKMLQDKYSYSFNISSQGQEGLKENSTSQKFFQK